MKYRNTGNGIIWTFVRLSFLSISVICQIWKAPRQFIVMYDFRLAISVGYVTFAVGWTRASNNACEC